MPSRQQRVAASRYRQVRLTLTQETSGRVNYSIYAKGLNEAWNEHQVLVRDSVPHDPPLLSSEDVYALLIHVLREQLLPGID
uniref:Uncharacterized protein n=1 Tax=uncultured prokaryote TaxID=198431 RepID=A0A0H5Q5U7_9ZZZZ|nr:hypothetical protein [uncultured prokaryote]